MSSTVHLLIRVRVLLLTLKGVSWRCKGMLSMRPWGWGPSHCPITWETEAMTESHHREGYETYQIIRGPLRFWVAGTLVPCLTSLLHWTQARENKHICWDTSMIRFNMTPIWGTNSFKLLSNTSELNAELILILIIIFFWQSQWSPTMTLRMKR